MDDELKKLLILEKHKFGMPGGRVIVFASEKGCTKYELVTFIYSMAVFCWGFFVVPLTRNTNR